ncbi:MAG: PilZ domain-containing protein [Deltaproteobacteria bacterium]|nr:PilZ domain-containing protein [Deltaproteobacteria bacterium]
MVLADPDEAYEWLRAERRRTDLVLVDVCQLEFDGLGVLSWLKTKGLLGDLSVWIVEDPFDPTSAEVCQACGITRCASKSWTPDDLADAVLDGFSAGRAEKRRHPRVAVSAPVVLGLFEKKIEGLLTDVSVTGAFVETSNPFPVDTKVSMRFQLPGGNVAASVRGRVVRVNVGGRRASRVQVREGMGLEFEDVSAIARAAITGYLERYGGAARTRAPWTEAETGPLEAGDPDAAGDGTGNRG